LESGLWLLVGVVLSSVGAVAYAILNVPGSNPRNTAIGRLTRVCLWAGSGAAALGLLLFARGTLQDSRQQSQLATPTPAKYAIVSHHLPKSKSTNAAAPSTAPAKSTTSVVLAATPDKRR